MIIEIDFKVKGEERKKLAYAIGELLGMPVKYTRTPKFDYLIGSNVLDKNGVFHASEDMTESMLELVLERFYKGEPIQQSEQREDETEEADVLSISVPRNMFIIRVFTYIFTAKGEYIYDRFKLRINGAKNES